MSKKGRHWSMSARQGIVPITALCLGLLLFLFGSVQSLHSKLESSRPHVVSKLTGSQLSSYSGAGLAYPGFGRCFVDRAPIWEIHGVLAPNAQVWPTPTRRVPMFNGAPSTNGLWVPSGERGIGGNVVFTTQVEPYPGAQSVDVAWINQTNASLSIYAGTTQPGGSFAVQGYVPPSLQSSLVAAFEGGFQFSVANGGFYQQGVMRPPLVNGAASLVQYQDGTLNIGTWGNEVSMSPSVVAVRQNLLPLVSNGAINPLTNYKPLVTWGYSLGNLVSTWRSGIGITNNGNLIWVGGPGLSPYMLAKVLVWAGSVRAMQLDINPDWVNFATYEYVPGQGSVGTNLSPAMFFPPSHYLNPFWRDFVAVFIRED